MSKLQKFRDELALQLESQNQSLSTIKSDDAVDDEQCDAANNCINNIINAFNEVCADLGLKPLEKVASLEPSPYQ